MGILETFKKKMIRLSSYLFMCPTSTVWTYLKMGFIIKMKIAKRLREFNKGAGKPTIGADSGEECVLIS